MGTDNWSADYKLKRLRMERPVRTRNGKLIWLATTQELPEWWPCLCNGGDDPCPICQCGLEYEPPCVLCMSSPVEPRDIQGGVLGDPTDLGDLAAANRTEGQDDAYWAALEDCEVEDASYYEELLHQEWREAC